MSNLKKILQLSFLIALMCSSCYQKIEGCLEVEATNFNAEADDACPKCCTYPTLSLRADYRNGDSTWVSGDTIITSNGNQVILLDFDLVFGDIRLSNNADTLRIIESEEVSLWTGMEAVPVERPNNVMYINPRRFTHTIGSYIFQGSITSATMDLAPVIDYQSVLPESWSSSTHPLRTVNDNGLWQDSMYQFVQLEFVEQSGDTTVRKIETPTSSQMTIPTSFEILNLESVSLSFEWDWAIMLNEIDLEGDTDGEIIDKFVRNGANSIIIGR